MGVKYSDTFQAGAKVILYDMREHYELNVAYTASRVWLRMITHTAQRRCQHFLHRVEGESLFSLPNHGLMQYQ